MGANDLYRSWPAVSHNDNVIYCGSFLSSLRLGSGRPDGGDNAVLSSGSWLLVFWVLVLLEEEEGLGSCDRDDDDFFIQF